MNSAFGFVYYFILFSFLVEEYLAQDWERCGKGAAVSTRAKENLLR